MFGKFIKEKRLANSAAFKLFSVFSKTASLSGDLKLEGDLRIDGTVVGEIQCEGKIVIGPDGNIEGNVRSKSIDLQGKLLGDVYVSEMCILRATSICRGKIQASKIEVEAGADFCGDCQTESLSQLFVEADESKIT